MERYVVKKDGVWKVVDEHYKKSIENFDTQQEAIDFARNMKSTTSILVQGRDHKFNRHYPEKRHKEGEALEEVCFTTLPKEVVEHSDWLSAFLEAINNVL